MTEDSEELLDVLDIVPQIHGRGRGSRSLYVAYERDLTQADIEALALPRAGQPKSLIKIHASHHALARCLAMGMRQNQAALVTGYSPNRVNLLLHDPAFQDLVQDYKNEAKEIFADAQQLMAGMHIDAIMLLREKMEEKPEEFTPGMLMDMIKGFADRTGHGPNQDVSLRIQQDFIDRPPRESFADWERRRNNEITPESPTADPLLLEDPLDGILEPGKKLN